MSARSIRLLPLLLLGALTCRAPAPPPATTRAYETRRTRLANGLGVQLEIPPGPGPRPAVINQHFGTAAALLARGVVIVSFTRASAAPPPPSEPLGATVGQLVLASPSAGVLGRAYLRAIVAAGTEDVPHVLDYLVTVPEIDSARIGIAGASTNGFAALQALAADDRLAAAVVAFACGDYFRFLRFSSMGMRGEPLTLDDDYARWLVAVEPDTHTPRPVPAALLLIGGTRDVLVPFSCVQATARKLGAAYAAAHVPERFRFIAVDRGHGVGPAEQAEAVEWLARWLGAR
jgi:hypothetical protein